MKSKNVLTVILFFVCSMAWSQGFTIAGNELHDANGNNFVMKGINVPLAWFVNDVNNNIAALKASTGSNCFRIVVTTTTPDNAWQTCVQRCIDNKIIPMVELHDVTGNNSPTELNRMAQFWASKAAYLTRPEIARYILINIANEWSDWNMSATATGTVSRVTWRDAYITAVRTIRNAGIKTTLVCDAGGYGQDNKAQTILTYAKAVQASDTYHNCLFSIHMYCEWSVGGNSSVTSLLPSIKNADIPIIVGEFGYQHSEGNGTCDINESQIINTANSNGIGWLAWSLKGNGSPVEYLDLSTNWTGTSLTAWGNTVVNGAGGTKTAVNASVFTATANGAPTVSLTAPAANTSFTAPATLSISANAADSDGSISNVQFYNGTMLLGSDASAPYSYSWSNVAAGTYSITAKATDNSGAVTSSAAVSVTVSTVTTGSGRALSNPNASNEAKALYCYIQNLSGRKILSGQMWSGWGFDELAYIQTNTGKQPAILGLDFIQESANNTQVTLAKNYWQKGGIPTIMWHMGAPGKGEGYPSSQLTIDINRCFQPGTAEYVAFWAELAKKADHLQTLRDAGVPVLWRPFHELNGGWFWWGKGSGATGESNANKAALFKKLWVTMYNYFVNTRQLNNLIWVLCYTGSPDGAWFPGNQYVDIAGGDEYATTNDPQLTLYNNVKSSIGGNVMPITLHECGVPPDPTQCLSRGSMWSWFMEWHTSHLQNLDKTYLKIVYAHDVVITLDEVGSIMTACGTTACTPTSIVPYVQTDGVNWLQQSTAQICAGYTLAFGPQPSVVAGWTWTGPNNFTATTREITLTNITSAQAGVYTATYINAQGCSSTSRINVTVNPLPALPMVITPVMYCQNRSAGPLTATGTSLKWYTTATGATALAGVPTPVTTSVGTTNYYVSQTTNGCESLRAQIAVIVNALPNAPTVAASVTYCQNTSASVLTATGSSLKWYAAAAGGTVLANAPTPATTTVGTTNYYVSQTSNGCESSRAQIAVAVNALPNAPTVAASVTYCQNTSASVLTATGTSLKWYTTATGGTVLANAPTPATTTVGTTNYYVSQTSNGCESLRAQIAVAVNALPNAPTVAASVTYCQNTSASVLTATGTSLKWYTTATGGTALPGAPTPITTSVGTTNYYVSQTTNGCESLRAQIAVAVNALPNAPTVAASVTYCQNTSASVLTATGSSLKWYAAAAGGTVLANAPTPATTTVGTTNYYVSQTSNGCESSRAQIAVTVNASPNATITAGGSATFCQGAAVTLTASAGSSYVWKNGSIVVGTNQTYNAATSGNYSVEVSNGSNCKATSAPTVVTVNALPAAPSVSTPVTYCQNVTASSLTANGSGLKWYTAATGGTVLSGAPIPITTTAGITNYYVSQTTNGCESSRAQIAVTINNLPPATITAGSSTTFCQGSAVTLTASAGSSYVWKNGSIVVGTNQTYNAATSGNYSVEVTNASNCKATSAPTNVTVHAFTTWYADMDGDGTGDAAVSQSACSMPTGYVATAGDECPADANKITAGNCGCGSTESSCVDCAGVPNGTASMDVCNRCSGGTTGITPVTDAAECTTTAVVDLTSTDEIKILPNPSQDEFTLLLTDVSTVHILTVQGRLVEVFENVNTLSFGSAYAKGVYVVQVNNTNGTQVVRVIKQ